MRAEERYEAGTIAPRAGLLLLLLLSILPYLNGLQGTLILDDQYLIGSHPAVQAKGFALGKILTTPYWTTLKTTLLWRPVTTLSFAIDWKIGGGGTVWFHIVNVLLHAAVTILLALLVRRVTRRDGIAFAAAALFAVHPLHTEAVTWISGRAELLAAAFGLAGIHLSLAERVKVRALVPLAVLFAIGSKESAAAIPLLMVFVAWATGARRPLRPALASIAPILIYVVARRVVLGTWAGPAPHPLDNPMVGHGILARMPTVMDCAGRYVGLVLWPARLSLDYSAPVLNLVRGVTPFFLLGLGATILLVWLAVRRRSTPEGFGAALAILTFALASNLPVVIGTIFAERLFYLPSAGILIVIASGGAALASRRIPANVLRVILAATVVMGVGRTFARNRDYRDERTMYAAAARAMPKSPKMRYNNAVQLGKLGRPEDALREAIEAIRLNPSSRECRGVIAASLDTLGRRDEAIRTLVKFLALDPKDHDSRVNLILLLEKDGAGARVDSVLEAGLVQDPECVEWIERSARRAQTRGDFVHAIPLWREAVRHIGESADDALNLAWCLLVTGDAGGARDAYRTALRLTPSSAVAANGLAWSILESGGAAAEAVRLAEQATAAERNPSYLDTLARAYIATGRCAEAVRAAEEAIALEPDKAAYRERLEEARRCH